MGMAVGPAASMTTAPDEGIAPALEQLVRVEAWSVFRRFPQGIIELDDLIGFGYLGLLDARDRYDPRRGVNFEIYARYRIRGAIYDGLRDMGLLSRKLYRALRQQVIAWRAAGAPRPTPAGGPSAQDDSYVLYSTIANLATAFMVEAALPSQGPDPERSAVQRDDLDRLRRAIAKLDDEERGLLAAIYDLDRVGDSGGAYARREGHSRFMLTRRHRAVLERLRALMGVEVDP